jgi:hypothetical protein
MLYEISSRRTVIDRKGFDKSVTEHFLVDRAEFFADAEQAGIELYNGENDIVAIKRSNLKEFVNKRRDDDEQIFIATIELISSDGNGNESKTKFDVALFAYRVDNAMTLILDYMKGIAEDHSLVGVKKSKFLDLIVR